MVQPLFSKNVTTNLAKIYFRLLDNHFPKSNGITEFLNSRRWTLDAEFWRQDAGLWTLDAGSQTLASGCWTLDSGRWTLDAGLWTLGITLRKLGSGHLTLLSTGSEQNQNSVFDSSYSIKSIGSNVKR